VTAPNSFSPNQVWASPASGAAGQMVVRSLVASDLPAGVGTGTVTSVGLTAPAIFNVTGSPVTTAGSLNLGLANQSANQVWAGPASGGAAAPGFRALVAGDIPGTLNAEIIDPYTGSGVAPSPPSANTPLIVRAADGVQSNITVQSFGTGSSANFQSANGTRAAPTATTASQNFGIFRIYGFDGSNFIQGGNFRAVATQNWTVGSNGTAFQMLTTENGSASIRVGLMVDHDTTLYQGQLQTVATLASSTILATTITGRTFVSDSTVGPVGNFGEIVVGGGTNVVPVWNDGTHWRIG